MPEHTPAERRAVAQSLVALAITLIVMGVILFVPAGTINWPRGWWFCGAFLVATLISGRAALPHANASDVYLTALAALLTLIYCVGLVFRPTTRVLGMGVDSATVLVTYLLGVAGLFAVTGA